MNSASPRARRIVVVDDQAEFLRIARSRLTRDACLEVVGEVTSGEAALDLVTRLTPGPDGVLLDVEMPGLDGFETARRLRALAPDVRIILTSASVAAGYGAVAGRIGAAFLPKNRLSAEAVLNLLD
ncbi:MAG: response regulator [Chloroflexi bacterium]|nr:response regulator [Chloroflexota bacterium]MBV9597909.1 response regulator [Chloroflexota bacterium]